MQCLYNFRKKSISITWESKQEQPNVATDYASINYSAFIPLSIVVPKYFPKGNQLHFAIVERHLFVTTPGMVMRQWSRHKLPWFWGDDGLVGQSILYMLFTTLREIVKTFAL